MAWWAIYPHRRPTRAAAALGKNGTRMRNHTRGKNRTKDQNRTRKKKYARNATDRARKRKGDVRDDTAERGLGGPRPRSEGNVLRNEERGLADAALVETSHGSARHETHGPRRRLCA